MNENPKNLAEILQGLPERIPFVIQDELIELWFPPGVIGGVIDPKSRQAAEDYAAYFRCLFVYAPERKHGYFMKQPAN